MKNLYILFEKISVSNNTIPFPYMGPYPNIMTLLRSAFQKSYV